MEKTKIIENVLATFAHRDKALSSSLSQKAKFIYDICIEEGFCIPYEKAVELFEFKNIKESVRQLRNDFKEGEDYVVREERQASGQKKKCYFISSDCFQELGMKRDTPVCKQVRCLYIALLKAVRKFDNEVKAGKIRFYEGKLTEAELKERPHKRKKTCNASISLKNTLIQLNDGTRMVPISHTIAGSKIHDIFNVAWSGCTRKQLAIRLKDKNVNVSDHDTILAATYKAADKMLACAMVRACKEEGIEVNSKKSIQIAERVAAMSKEKQDIVKKVGGLLKSKLRLPHANALISTK